MNLNFDYLKNISETADQKAILQDLMTSFGEDVWNYAYSILKNREEADDITQEVFLKVFRNLFSFRGESSIKTWLLTITRNTAYDHRRSAFFRKVTLVDFIPNKGAHPSAENEAIANMAINGIWKQVLQLPMKYREVLILFGHYHLSMKEMAELLGISEGTVKSRLHHARTKVMKMKEGVMNGVE